LNSNQGRRKRKQKKEKEKKKKLLGPPARSSPASAQQQACPTRAQQPSKQPSARRPRPRASPLSLVAAATWPRMSAAPPPQCRLPPTPQPPRDRRPTAMAGVGQGGHARGTALSPWRCAHATMRAPLDASMRLRSPLIPIRRSPSSMAELGYKSLGPGCPRACPIAPPPPCGHPPHTRAKRERG